MEEVQENFGPVVKEVPGGLQIQEENNRWYILSRSLYGNRPILFRVATTYATDNEGGIQTDLWEATVHHLSGKPLSLVRYDNVPPGLDLSRPFEDVEPETVLDPAGVKNKPQLLAFHQGPVRHLQEWSSDRPLDVDRQLARLGYPNFRKDLGLFDPRVYP